MFGPKQQLMTRSLPAATARAGDVLRRNQGVVGLIMVLTLASYVVLDRTLATHRDASLAIGLTQRQHMLSQRIASLTAQHALGSIGVRSDLRSAVDALDRSERLLVTGDTSGHVRPASADPALRAIYFGAPAALDAAVRNFVADARQASTMSPSDSGFARVAGRIFAAARKPLPDRLDAAVEVRQAHLAQSLAMLRGFGVATALALIAALAAQALGVVRPMARRAVRLANDLAELARTATTDPLTGMLNTRGFNARGALEIQKARRYNRPLSLLKIDPDHFAAISATHGAAAGDTLLRALTATLFDGTRTTDLVGRIGNDEFAILLPETDPAGAKLLAERLRGKISTLTVPIANHVVSCTVSIGVAAAEEGAMFFEPTYARADEALYEAKIRGRNRVFVNAA